MEQNKCNKCGRPMQYATEPKCNYCDSCMSEYCGRKLGRIKEVEPTCDSTAVIPSITVDTVDGITNLANCLVHVTSTNTTYYVDDKHRIMITWAGPVNIPGYDMEGNPKKFKDQIVTDVEAETAVIYDNHGKGYIFGITPENLQQAVNDKLDEMAADGTLESIISQYIEDVVFGFDTVADMQATTNLIDGSFVRTLGYYTVGDGGGAVYKINSTDTPNGMDIISLNNGLVATFVPDDNMSPKQFGAKGDNTQDDSDYLQAYIDSSKTGINVNFGAQKAVYKITKTLDLGGRGISGGGFSIHEDYNKCSLHFVDGTYNGYGLTNVGHQVKNILIRADGELSAVDGINLGGEYNTVIENVGMFGFRDQIVIDKISVALRVNNFSGTMWNGCSFHIKDTESAQSTTTWFNECLFYWSSGEAIKFDKQLYSASFNNIILESLNGGISASLFYYCNFNGIYAESTYDNENHPWLYWTTGQQCIDNNYIGIFARNPWSDPCKILDELTGNNAGGVVIDETQINLRDSTGGGVVVDRRGIHTNHANWLGTSYRPLIITTQPSATDSGYSTPIHIKAPNGGLYLKNQDDSTTAVTVKRVVGDNNGDEVLGTDVYDFREKSWSHTYPATNSTNTFSAMMLFNYDQKHTTPTNGSWTLTREDTGTFLLSRSGSSTQVLLNPSIIVSGAVVSTVNGDGTPLVHGVQLVNSYSGEYASYSTCKEIRIKFYNLQGTLTDPTKFTLAITQK